MGKTTLLTRIAAGDINNFPKEVSTYYIQHEILAEAGTSVTMFMHGQVPEGCTTAEIMAALYEVGFTDERASAAVSELSGGWRMKLAIARSMLWNADLLLLDEPTNQCALPAPPARVSDNDLARRLAAWTFPRLTGCRLTFAT